MNATHHGKQHDDKEAMPLFSCQHVQGSTYSSVDLPCNWALPRHPCLRGSDIPCAWPMHSRNCCMRHLRQQRQQSSLPCTGRACNPVQQHHPLVLLTPSSLL